MSGHRSPSSGCLAIRNAIQKYGWGVFEQTIVCECKIGGQERLNALEVYFIKKYKGLAPSGYNLTTGGSNGRPSEETLERMQAASKKYWADPEAREKNRQALLKYYETNPDAVEKNRQAVLKYWEDNPEARERMSEIKKQHWADPDARERMSELKKQYWEDPEARAKQSELKKRLYEEDPGMVERNRQAQLKYHEDNPDARLGNSERTTRYYQENPDAGAEHSVRMKQYWKDHPHNRCRKIHQYSSDGKTFIKEWMSTASAERELSIGKNYVSSVCQGNKKLAGGFFWRYADA